MLFRSTYEKASDAVLNASSMYAALRNTYPKQFDDLVSEFYLNIQKGKSRSETIEALQSKMAPFIISLIAQADDDVVVAYTRILIAQYKALGNGDPSSCYYFASGERSVDLSVRRQII